MGKVDSTLCTYCGSPLVAISRGTFLCRCRLYFRRWLLWPFRAQWFAVSKDAPNGWEALMEIRGWVIRGGPIPLSGRDDD